MPELPEIAALVGFLRDRTVGRRIDDVRMVSFAALKTFDPPIGALIGKNIEGVGRRGKFVVLEVEGGLLMVLHLSLSGWVRWHAAGARLAPPRPGRGPLALRVGFDDSSALDVTEQATEKRLAAYVVRDLGDVAAVARLGQDPLDPRLTLRDFAAELANHPAQLKSLLTDQTVFAGIGNAYSDEILHAARLSPFRRSTALTDEESARLHGALCAVLAEAVHRAQGHAASELKADKRVSLRVHGRTGEPCPACGDTIRQVALGSRSLQYCPTCQTGGKALKDRRLSRLLR